MSSSSEKIRVKLNERKNAIVREMTHVLSKLSFAVINAEELKTVVQQFVETCITSITSDDVDQKGAESIGETLSSLHFIRPHILGAFQSALYKALLQHLSDEEKCRILSNLLEVLSGISNGYTQNAVSIILKQQEEIRSAYVEQVEKARTELKELYDQLDSLVTIRTRELSEANKKLAEEIKNHEMAELALKESEGRYRTLAESAPDFIFIIDRNDVVEYVNQHAAKLFHRKQGELVGCKRSELFGGATLQIQNKSLQKVFNEEQSLHEQDWTELSNGDRIFLDTRLAPIKENGVVRAVLGISRDLTQQKLAEQKIADQEKKYHTLFDTIHNAILLIDNGVIVDCNRSSETVFGMPSEKILGETFVKLLKKRTVRDKQFIHQMTRKIELCLQDKVQHFEVDYLRTDGELLHLEINLTRFPEGNAWRVLAVVRNITPYKRALEALLASELRFKDIVSRSIDGYYFIDVNYRLRQLNKSGQQILTYTKEEINTFFRLDSKGKRSRDLLKLLKTAMSGKSLSWEEFKFIDKQGKARWIALNARRVYDGGEVAGVEGFIKDITDRKRAEAELIESEARYKALFESTPYDVFGLTIDRRFIKVNQNFMNQWGRYEGKRLEALRPKTLANLIADLCTKVRTKGLSVESSYRYKSKEKYFRVIVAPNLTEKKRIIGYAGLIIDVTDSYNALQEKSKFAEALIRTSEEEQRRISREIHDSLGQMLFALQVELSSVKANFKNDSKNIKDVLYNAESLLTKSMQEASNLCYRLHPRLLDDFGLQEALEDIVANIQNSGKIEISFQSELNDSKLNKNVETALFRVAQEAFANILKHSQATKVDMVLQARTDGIAFSIRDNGCGFHLQKMLQSKTRGFGLLNMKERIELIGGALKIDTALNQGVLIDIFIPKTKV